MCDYNCSESGKREKKEVYSNRGKGKILKIFSQTKTNDGLDSFQKQHSLLVSCKKNGERKDAQHPTGTFVEVKTSEGRLIASGQCIGMTYS